MSVLSHTNIMQNVLTNKDQSVRQCLFASLWTSDGMTVTQGVLRSSSLVLNKDTGQGYLRLVSAGYSKSLNAKCFVLCHFKP